MLTTRQFNWRSAPEGKPDFHHFDSLLKATLATGNVGHCYSEEESNFQRPDNPIPEPPANAKEAERLNYIKLKQARDKTVKEFSAGFDKALGILRTFFPFGSMALQDIDMAVVKPDDILPAEWTSEAKFRAAMKAIKEYAPRDHTDISELRRELESLSDNQGFYAYRAKFAELLSQLIAARAKPPPGELLEWVKKGITNTTVRSALAQSVSLEPNLTYEMIFERIDKYLKWMGEQDPYKTVTAKITATAVGVNLTKKETREIRCTRCWRNGHPWKNCTATTCSQCGQPLKGAPFCANYKTHSEPGTTWAPPHLLKKELPTPPSTKDIGSASEEARMKVKEARKALNIAVREAKRLKG
jgi:hypothetical protein